MNKKLCFLIIALFTAALFADENQAEIKAQTEQDTLGDAFYIQIEAGFGADFTGTPGRLPDLEIVRYDSAIVSMSDQLLRNQFGVTVGIDFNWRVFQQIDGDGAGELYFGFGGDFQYWLPTADLSDDNFRTNPKEKFNRYAALRYMRVPVMFNLFYDFKVNAGTLRRVGPKFSAGVNNNFFILEYDYDHERKSEGEELEKFSKDVDFHQLSFTWSLGLNLVFSSRCFLAVSIGGDKGSEQVRRNLFLENSGRILYNHHEFIMFETGYRL